MMFSDGYYIHKMSIGIAYLVALTVLIIFYFVYANISDSKNRYISRRDLLPTSGYEHQYSPFKWNILPMIFTHNCYDYAFDNYNMLKTEPSQPGFIPNSSSHESGNRLTCAGVNERLNSDHGDRIQTASRNIPCGQGKYKIALIADPNDDYHFLRQDRDGTWSHKPGNTPATNLDFAGKVITDPEKAVFVNDEFNYSDFCNYFCVERDTGMDFKN